ncbi:hypothetical protein BH20ACI2_BH20ACI2_04310 [soil metagenome]
MQTKRFNRRPLRNGDGRPVTIYNKDPGGPMDKYTIICPCCEATLKIDAETGSLLAHEEKKKITGSFEDLKGEMSKLKDQRDQIFAQQMSSVKDRERLLEEKFKEALKRADTDSGLPFRNPLDLD